MKELLNLIRANEALLEAGIKRIEQVQLAYVVFLKARIRNVDLAKLMRVSPAACRGTVLSLDSLGLLRTETITREQGGRDLWVIPTPYLQDVLWSVYTQLNNNNNENKTT